MPASFFSSTKLIFSQTCAKGKNSFEHLNLLGGVLNNPEQIWVQQSILKHWKFPVKFMRGWATGSHVRRPREQGPHCVSFKNVFLHRIPIKTAFPDYTGKPTYEESIEFVQARFKEQKKQGPVCILFDIWPVAVFSSISFLFLLLYFSPRRVVLKFWMLPSISHKQIRFIAKRIWGFNPVL